MESSSSSDTPTSLSSDDWGVMAAWRRPTSKNTTESRSDPQGLPIYDKYQDALTDVVFRWIFIITDEIVDRAEESCCRGGLTVESGVWQKGGRSLVEAAAGPERGSRLDNRLTGWRQRSFKGGKQNRIDMINPALTKISMNRQAGWNLSLLVSVSLQDMTLISALQFAVIWCTTQEPGYL